VSQGAESRSELLKADPEEFGRAFVQRALDHARGVREQKKAAGKKGDEPVEIYMKVVVHGDDGEVVAHRARNCICTYYGDGDIWICMGDACIDVC
jgi:hypothetical protein